ncbi:MAG TPA: hypothetical protein VFL59_11600 [Candidatus Nanopelagicales bacterium]|nr:hypothetical protein [Candidatus Nanopelagicales bacterium]
MSQLRTPLLVLVAALTAVAGPIVVAPAASAVSSTFSQVPTSMGPGHCC